MRKLRLIEIALPSGKASELAKALDELEPVSVGVRRQ